MTNKKKTYKKVAFVLSLSMILVWALLGTGASLAWFKDTSQEVGNVFHVAEFDLDFSYRLEDGITYKEIKEDTNVFDEDALYEPGYVEVVFLKVTNNGTVPFNFETAVSVADYNTATNVFDDTFYLHEELRFGLVLDTDEEALEQKVARREDAKQYANRPLNYYATEVAELEAKDTVYMALIVYMPKEVDNEANYRGTEIPWVKLRLITNAEQIKQ